MIDFINFFLLQVDSTAAEGGQAGPKWLNWVLIGGVVIVFYFFMLRPQQKKRKEEQEFRSNLGKGDKVVTIGGIHGKIVSMDESNQTALIEVDNGVKMRFELGALKPAPDPQAAENKK